MAPTGGIEPLESGFGIHLRPSRIYSPPILFLFHRLSYFSNSLIVISNRYVRKIHCTYHITVFSAMFANIIKTVFAILRRSSFISYYIKILHSSLLKWSCEKELNLRPLRYKLRTLTTELPQDMYGAHNRTRTCTSFL